MRLKITITMVRIKIKTYHISLEHKRTLSIICDTPYLPFSCKLKNWDIALTATPKASGRRG